MTDLKQGTRLLHKRHPEFGFGMVKMVEEDALGDTRCQVSFDHIDQYEAVHPDEVTPLVSPFDSFSTGAFGPVQALKRKLAAGTILGENNATGAFLRVSIQPLPHQAFVLDKILSRNRFGHLLADDVGLGKTIEAGLIISTVLQQDTNQKIMIVCPAGLALQWQEEMKLQFSLFFSVLGRNHDFNGRSAGGWAHRRLVIAPIDQIKRAEYAEILKKVGPFHLVVCDEAHRLSARREFISRDLRTTANFRLFKELVDSKCIEFVTGNDAVPRSPRLLLLTATPHQGDDLRFGYLLKLIRPDLFSRKDESIRDEFTGENLFETITRTAKSRAVGWDGGKLFKGHVSQTIDVDWTEPEKKASDLLTGYIHLSLEAAHGGSRGAALVIEMVMHTFHKIAASSWKAIRVALNNRRSVIGGGQVDPTAFEEDEDEDDRESIHQGIQRSPFFTGERELLENLINFIDQLPSDTKWNLCADLLRKLDSEKPGVRVLIFTQYRSTQMYLCEKLKELFSDCAVEVINGDVGLDDRGKARKRFESSSRFMVSTEAGGEGINLQKACYVMINYDLPWNPMRLQQRIGRLDRYGQKEIVRVFNLRVMNSWDSRISLRILERLDSIQKTMEMVTEDAEDYEEMILGAIADQVNETELFVAAQQKGHGDPSDAQVDEWIRNALGSVKRWEKVLHRDLGMPEGGLSTRTRLTSDDFRRAFAIVLDQHGLRLTETRTEDRKSVEGVYHFTIPKAFKDPIFRPSPEIYLTFDRDRFADVRGQVLGRSRGQDIEGILAGFGEPITDWLFESSFAAADLESSFSIRMNSGWRHGEGWLLVAALRWMGKSRRLKAPDSLAVCFKKNGQDFRLLTSGEVMEFVRCCETAGTHSAGRIPEESSPEKAKALVQGELRRLLENRDPGSRATASWSWLCVAQVECE